MENPKIWTKDELLGYVLVYVLNSDLNESRKETKYILNRIDKEAYKRVSIQFEKNSDCQSIQNI